jgi:hypothetical protein
MMPRFDKVTTTLSPTRSTFAMLYHQSEEHVLTSSTGELIMVCWEVNMHRLLALLANKELNLFNRAARTIEVELEASNVWELDAAELA